MQGWGGPKADQGQGSSPPTPCLALPGSSKDIPLCRENEENSQALSFLCFLLLPKEILNTSPIGGYVLTVFCMSCFLELQFILRQ